MDIQLGFTALDLLVLLSVVVLVHRFPRIAPPHLADNKRPFLIYTEDFETIYSLL
jgi:hypothetical protein